MADHVKSRLEMDIEHAAVMDALNEREVQRERAFREDMNQKLKQRHDAQMKEQLQRDIEQGHYEAELAARKRSMQQHGSNTTNDPTNRAMKNLVADLFGEEPEIRSADTDAKPLRDPKKEAEKNALRKLLESL